MLMHLHIYGKDNCNKSIKQEKIYVLILHSKKVKLFFPMKMKNVNEYTDWSNAICLRKPTFKLKIYQMENTL